MKRLFVWAVAVCTFFSFHGVALAADMQEYSLDELYMKISIPNDYIVVTRDTKSLPKEFEEIGVALENLQYDLKSANAYLDAYKTDFTDSIRIVVSDSTGVFDLRSYTTEQLEQYIQEVVDDMNRSTNQSTDAQNAQIADALLSYERVCEYPDARYIVMSSELSMADNTYHALQYSTVKNGLAINTILYSYKGSLISEQEQMLDDVIKTIHFKDLPAPIGADTVRTSAQENSIWYNAFIKAIAYVIIAGIIGGVTALAVYFSKKSRAKKTKDDQNI